MATRISQWRPEDRPRERLLTLGPEALSDAELVAILIGHGVRGGSAIDLALGLLQETGGLAALGRLSVPDLLGRKGLGPAKAARVFAACELGRRRERSTAPRGEAVTLPETAVRVAAARIRDRRQECLLVLLLDAKHRVCHEEIIGVGGWEQAAIQPREVFRPAIAHAAAALILAHNHPSGDPTPSPADLDLTRRLQQAAKCLGIRFLDHVIIGDGRYTSLRAEGYFPNSSER